jgi:glycyl-tRNA synthetase (class II)
VILVADANEPAGQIGRRFASRSFLGKLFCVTPDAK